MKTTLAWFWQNLYEIHLTKPYLSSQAVCLNENLVNLQSEIWIKLTFLFEIHVEKHVFINVLVSCFHFTVIASCSLTKKKKTKHSKTLYRRNSFWNVYAKMMVKTSLNKSSSGITKKPNQTKSVFPNCPCLWLHEPPAFACALLHLDHLYMKCVLLSLGNYNWLWQPKLAWWISFTRVTQT